MNNPRLDTLLLCIALFLSSCSENMHVFSDRDTKIDLQQYKTYAWVAPGDTVLNAKRKDKLYGGYIVYASDEELKKKGMSVNTSDPDALFIFETKLEEKVKYTQEPTVSVGVGYGGPGYYVGGSAPVAGGGIKSSAYEEGMLIINMYDRRSGNLIWSGGAKESLTNSTDVETVIKKAVKFIFVRLPIKHKGG
jgi:hypothetical protein